MPLSEHRKEWFRNWQREQRRLYPKRYQAYDLKKKQKLKRDVLSHYSPNLTCKRCGFNDVRALTIHHPKHDGAEHRRQIGGGSKNHDRIYRWLKKNGYPPGYEVFCMNCQFIVEAEYRNTYRQKWYTDKKGTVRA